MNPMQHGLEPAYMIMASFFKATICVVLGIKHSRSQSMCLVIIRLL